MYREMKDNVMIKLHVLNMYSSLAQYICIHVHTHRAIMYVKNDDQVTIYRKPKRKL